MKLRNIIAIGLSLTALASCSKDDLRSVDVNDLKNAKLNISLKASAPGGTKAGGDEYALDGETNINNMAVLTFSAADGILLSEEPFWTSNIDVTDDMATVTDVPSKETKALIVAIANVPENAFSGITTYSDFQSRLAQLTDQSQNSLAMSSRVVEADVAGGDNYIGYATASANLDNINTPLELVRLAARIELASAKTNFDSKASLRGRTVQINSIYLANEKTASRFASTAYWGAVMVDGNLLTARL
ncbi:MAG: fimbrial protein [Parabacteroides sp.]|nr:fimbrial protein [Parabacteroides sp.]